MDEKRVNGTQADEAQGTEAQWDESEADGTLEDDTLPDGEGSDGLDVAKMRRLRLTGFLRELVRAEGRMEAAELLGVAYRTLVKAEESGELTGHMSDALERLLGTGEDPEAARLRERVGALEEGVDALAKEMRDGLEEVRAAVAGVKAGDRENGQTQDGENGRVDGQAQAQGGENGRVDGQAQAQGGENGEGAGRSETRAAPPVAGLGPKKPFAARRLDPEIVTEEPDAAAAAVYGAAWPLVGEWRRLRVDHPRQGQSLSWLVAEKRLLTLELAMLDDHGLTLPPEKQPLRGFGRKGQTNWRRKALYDTRVALRKRELLRWVLTLWLWRK